MMRAPCEYCSKISVVFFAAMNPAQSGRRARPERGARVVKPHDSAIRTGSVALALAVILALTGCSMLPGLAETEREEAPTRKRPLIQVEVNGVDGEPADNIRAHVSVARKPCDTAPAYLNQLGRRAVDETRKALRAFGQYEVEVAARVDRSEACPRAIIDVRLGPRTVLGEVHIVTEGAAANDEGFQAVIARHGLASGDGLHHGRYQSAKQLIERTALERGYLEGRFVRSAMKVDRARNVADIHIRFDSGPRYTVGEVRIAQEPTVVDDSLVRRFLDYTPGEAYTSAIVSRLYSALSASGYFSTVEVRPLLSAPEALTIPIEIELSPGKKHKVSTGAGFSTDEGIRGKAQYQNRRVNALGHRLRAETRASLIEQRFATEYQIPRAHPADEWFSVQGGVRRGDVDTFETIETQLGVAETKRRPWGWMERRFVNLNYQAFEVSTGSETTAFVIPGIRWTKTRADDPLFPSRGYAVDFEIRGAADAMLSETSFARALLSASAVKTLPLRTRLLLRTDLGWSWAEDFLSLPPTERFFAGGDVSIRGFDIAALGPVDDEGDVVGGRYLGVGSVEIEKTLVDRWGVALFVDAGNAYGGTGSSDGIRVGIGGGVRWYSPIGPIRVDLAHPLDDDTVARLHVRMGPDL